MEQVISKVQTYGKEIFEKAVQTFFKSGKKGYLKLAIASYFAIWGTHFALRSFGWLPKKNVRGSHIFITGAASGIGRLMALNFAKLGSKVSVVDLNLEGAQNVENEIKKLGAQAKAIQCDVSSYESVENAARVAVETFGEVEILINNAGIVSGKKLTENPPKLIEKTLQVNTIALGYVTKQFLPSMIAKNKGHIVTIASNAGLVGVCGLADYCASKFGAVGFDESLRMELRKIKSNVKTTCICPYYIDTGMFDGVKTRFPLLFPILKPNYVARRICNAIQQDEKIVVMPLAAYLAYLARALFPVSVFDAINDVLGVSSTMDEFKGRSNK